MDGNQVSGIAARQIRLMERLANVNFRVMQGGYGGHHIRASGTSHNYSGVVDLAPASIAVREDWLVGRVRGLGAEHRVAGRSVGSGAHIHAVSLLDPGDRSRRRSTGRGQRHGDGLGGGDPAPHTPWLPNLRRLLGNIPLINLGGGGGGGGGYSGPSVGDARSALNPGEVAQHPARHGSVQAVGSAAWSAALVGKLRGVVVDKIKSAISSAAGFVAG
jgi:hypothetical protein